MKIHVRDTYAGSTTERITERSPVRLSPGRKPQLSNPGSQCNESYHRFVRLIFRLSPETAHGVTLALLRMGGALRAGPRPAARRLSARPPGPPVHAFGLTFANPVGLAAGYDKDGLGWRGLAALGFGHLELGTVTPRPQPGNPRPRIFRLVEDRAVINRMGFPSRGAEFLAQRLRGSRPPGSDPGRQHRQEQGHAAGTRRRGLPDLVAHLRTAGGLSGRQRQLAEHARPAHLAEPGRVGGLLLRPWPSEAVRASATGSAGPSRCWSSWRPT